STFSVGDDFTFSPDSKYLVYTAPPERNEAWSTNYDIWRVPITGGKAENLTKDNPAADGCPRFSPDGKVLAYRAQRRAGFEADKWELWTVKCDSGGQLSGKPTSVTKQMRFSVSEFIWIKYDETVKMPHMGGKDWFMIIYDRNGCCDRSVMPQADAPDPW